MENNQEYLAHYGILGMKWGKRKARKVSADTKRKQAMKKDVKKRRLLSDADLKKKVERIKMEKQLKDLTAEEIGPGKKFAKEIISAAGKKTVTTLVAGASLYAVKYAMTKKFDIKDLAGYMTPKPKK